MSAVYDNNLASDLPPVSGTDASIAQSQTSAEPAPSCDPAVSALARNPATENATPAPRPFPPLCDACRLATSAADLCASCRRKRGLPSTPAPRPEALPAGRELDALVAEKVMGWRRVDDHLWEDADRRLRSTAPWSSWAFHPSTDIAAAWQVVEKIYPGMDLTFGRAKRDDGTVVWWIICAPEDDAEVIEIEAELFPLAIARAALAAVERAS